MEPELLNTMAEEKRLSLEPQERKILSTEECKKGLIKFNLREERIESIRNNLIGIADSIVNFYIEGFK